MGNDTERVALLAFAEADALGRHLYEGHALYHGFKPRWDDEPETGKSSWRNVARYAQAYRLSTIPNVDELTRPIIGIERRTAQEAFDIMADRIRAALNERKAPCQPKG